MQSDASCERVDKDAIDAIVSHLPDEDAILRIS
ncbi:MAG: transcriptional regulator, partial [Methanococcoides sp.]|nr:transcriptional regulator [Methanococcoides sp.]